MFMQFSQIFQRRKNDANKQDFENKLNFTCQAQSNPKTKRNLTKVFCTSGPNMVVLARMGDELSHGQAQNGVNFDFEVKFDLESHGQSLPKTIRILTKVFYIYGPNRVGQSREIYSNSVPLSPPHWPYPKRIRPPSWPRVAVASSIQKTKLFTWRTWPGAGAVPKCDWAARSQCGFKQRRADHNKVDIHLICCDAWPIRYDYGTDDCMNMITRMTTSIISSVIVWKMTIYFFHTHA